MPSNLRYSGYEEIGATHQELYNKEKVNLHIYGFKRNKLRLFIYHIVCLIFLGLPYLILNWFPKYKVKIKNQKCNLQESTIVLISDTYGNHKIERVKTDLNLKYFHYQHTKYVWLNNEQIFAEINRLYKAQTIDDYLNNTTGLFNDEIYDLWKLYGKNKIEVEIKSYWKLFVEEVFNPFYVFQVFSMILWYFDDYIIYAGCVFLLTLLSIVTALIETRKQNKAVHDLVESSKCNQVSVIRNGVMTVIEPELLVPGDLIVLPRADFIMPCDCILLNGQCIINESMLTGESVPITKTAPTPSHDIYNLDLHKRHILFSGTFMIQSRYYNNENVLARVLNTGFDTTKGSLIKSILYPTPIFLKFYKDSLKFVVFLFFLAAFGFGYTIYLYVMRHADLKDIIIRSVDIITIVVPPALPAALNIGIVYSQTRLKKLGIFCMSPARINICGKLKLICFDKTGTLTLDGLSVYSVLPTTKKAQFLPQIHNNDNNLLNNSCKWLQCMATCHSLTRIDGELNGDPLDLAMFEFTKWDFEEPAINENSRFDLLMPTIVSMGNYQIGIIRQFPFSSNLQCMSVISRDLNLPNMIAFTKGAPEKLINFCLKHTIPLDFHERLTEFTVKGYRVIALAYKELPVKFKWKEAQKIKRDFIECDLIFLGFLIMQNPLKPETAPVIDTLYGAGIRTVMITGDNILTAISVARDCGMVTINDEIIVIEVNCDIGENPKISLQNFQTNNQTIINFDFSNCHFAIDGKTWTKIEQYFPDLLPNFLAKTTIFARFQPDQKTQLISSFQKLDYIVAMVGDGANDCGALKAAHVGVSLSQAEASVAAPFTSKIENISCILHLMLEGRCALVTSFAVFKYMALYSLIQFFTVLILYKQHSILGDDQFLYIDLIITTALAVTIGRQGPTRKLYKKKPMGSLVSPHNLLPMVLQVFLCGFMQVSALLFLFKQSWYKPMPKELISKQDEVVVCWENTVLFTVSCFQYIILACVYSKGYPHRENLCKNFWFLISVLILTGFGLYLLILPTRIVADFFEIIYVSKNDHEKLLFKYELLMFPLLHLIIAFFIENFLAETVWLKTVLHFISRKKKPKNKFKLLLKESDDFCFRLNQLT